MINLHIALPLNTFVFFTFYSLQEVFPADIYKLLFAAEE